MHSQPSPLKITTTPLAYLLSAVTALLSFPAASIAQTAITGWTLGSSNAADSTAYGYTFRNETFNVINFTAGTTKTVDSSATTTYIRRSSDPDGNSNVWTVRDGTTGSNIRAMNPSAGTLDTVLSGNNVLQGANDLFVNTGGAPAIANSNVERIDFYWNGGFTTTSDQGFAVFDRGRNDGFQIAVITGWDTATNRPITYGATMDVAATSYGANLAADWVAGGGTETTFEATFLRFATDSTLTTLDSSQNATGQGVGGVYISFGSLGIPDGTTVYGYSLMAPDVTATNATLADLVDWNNTSVYLNNTSDTVGSIDLAGFNGRRFVPEPSTYGAILLFVSVAFVALRRRQVAVAVKVRA